MKKQLAPEKKRTVYSLLLHAIVLLLFATLYFYMLVQSGSTLGLNFTTTAYYGVMGVLAIWLSGRHYLRTVLRKYLNIWVAFHISVSLFIFFTIINLSSVHVGVPPTYFLPHLIVLTINIVPPGLIFVSARKERT